MNISKPTTTATEHLTQSLLQLQTVGQSNLIEIINDDSPENIPETNPDSKLETIPKTVLGRIKKDAMIATKIRNALKKKNFVFENPLS